MCEAWIRCHRLALHPRTARRTRFARRDADWVPAGWLKFDQRTSTLATGSSPRSASGPSNALLNYLYSISTAEAVFACRALGLEPSLGILHSDKGDRDSLALDLVEPIRPLVDTYILDLLASRTFSRADFTETRDGRCRILPPLTPALAETAPSFVVGEVRQEECLDLLVALNSRRPHAPPGR